MIIERPATLLKAVLARAMRALRISTVTEPMNAATTLATTSTRNAEVLPLRKETVAVPNPTPATNIIEPIKAMRIGRFVMLFERKLRVVLRRRESIRILANLSRTRTLISEEPQQYLQHLSSP